MTLTITITDHKCWNCGKKMEQDRTSHHAIPKTLNPMKNVVVPLCAKCHREVNSANVAQLSAFGHKLAREVKDLAKRVNVLTNLLDNMNFDKIKKRDGGGD